MSIFNCQNKQKKNYACNVDFNSLPNTLLVGLPNVKHKTKIENRGEKETSSPNSNPNGDDDMSGG